MLHSLPLQTTDSHEIVLVVVSIDVARASRKLASRLILVQLKKGEGVRNNQEYIHSETNFRNETHLTNRFGD